MRCRYNDLTLSINNFEQSHILAWCDQVSAVSDLKLKLPLLKRDASQPPLPLLAVNFDPDLEKLLRETKYFLQLKVEVPESALKIFERDDTFR